MSVAIQTVWQCFVVQLATKLVNISNNNIFKVKSDFLWNYTAYMRCVLIVSISRFFFKGLMGILVVNLSL
jgi:hypothetical protein